LVVAGKVKGGTKLKSRTRSGSIQTPRKAHLAHLTAKMVRL
jgi:hypothetical protein